MQTKLKDLFFRATFSENIFHSIHNTEVNEITLIIEECMSITIRTGLVFLQLILHLH